MTVAASEPECDIATSLSPESLPALIAQHHRAMLRLARMWTPDRATAEETVQEV